jgi:hypothetical protein
MRRLTVIAVMLVLLLGVMIAGAKLFAPPETYGFPLNVLLDTPPNCQLPCWHKIIPGVTTRDEAMAILSTDPSVESVYMLGSNGMIIANIKNTDHKGEIDVVPGDQNLVEAVELSGTGSAAEVLSVFGKPFGTLSPRKQDKQYFLDLLFPFALVTMNTRTMPKVETNVDLTILLATSGNAANLISSLKQNIWRGFTARYFPNS